MQEARVPDDIEVDLVDAKTTSRVCLPVVPDARVGARAPFLHHEGGRCPRVAHGEDANALRREFPEHEVAEGIRSDLADPGRLGAETTETDRDVALRATDAERHRVLVRQRAESGRAHEGHGLAQRDDTARDDAAHAMAFCATSTAAAQRSA